MASVAAQGESGASKFQFEHFRSTIKECIEKSLCNSAENVAAGYHSQPGSDAEKRPTVDQAFKDVLKSLVEEKKSTNDYIALIYLAVLAVQQELSSAAIPFVMLSEIFDTITIDECEMVFGFVEDRVDTWKADGFYNAGKNYLLRMCNDLLRRLSKSQHTIFCGRIQLFLARLFPLSEKSGLNLMSQFNLENITEFTSRAEDYHNARRASEADKDEAMEEGEMADTANSITIDYNMYKKFWELQDFFRKPLQCYDKEAWKKFSNYSEEVLACFESFKLDEVKSSKRRRDILKKAAQSQSFFAKYLTSEKLLDLQLSDGHFRRYVLVQFLILFQYLHAQVKFKTATHILTDDQTAWIKTVQPRVYTTLRETPPDGQQFAAAIEHILSREENWNNWKNEGCPSYVREAGKDTVKMPQRPPKRNLGEDLRASGGKLTKMGSAELTRLWNLEKDNMAACRSRERNFMPQPEVFFEDAIDQLDPEAQVDDEYKLINNSTFAWKSLRLLARKSPHFFALVPSNAQPGNKQSVAQYLEQGLNKLAKELPTNNENDEKTEVEDEGEEKLEEGEEEPEKQSDSASSPTEQEQLVTAEQCELLAEVLSGDWKKLATELNFTDEQMNEIESNSKLQNNITMHAEYMLSTWMENEQEKASVGALRQALKEVGLVELSAQVLGKPQDS